MKARNTALALALIFLLIFADNLQGYSAVVWLTPNCTCNYYYTFTGICASQTWSGQGPSFSGNFHYPSAHSVKLVGESDGAFKIMATSSCPAFLEAVESPFGTSAGSWSLDISALPAPCEAGNVLSCVQKGTAFSLAVVPWRSEFYYCGQKNFPVPMNTSINAKLVIDYIFNYTDVKRQGAATVGQPVNWSEERVVWGSGWCSAPSSAVVKDKDGKAITLSCHNGCGWSCNESASPYHLNWSTEPAMVESAIIAQAGPSNLSRQNVSIQLQVRNPSEMHYVNVSWTPCDGCEPLFLNLPANSLSFFSFARSVAAIDANFTPFAQDTAQPTIVEGSAYIKRSLTARNKINATLRVPIDWLPPSGWSCSGVDAVTLAPLGTFDASLFCEKNAAILASEGNWSLSENATNTMVAQRFRKSVVVTNNEPINFTAILPTLALNGSAVNATIEIAANSTQEFFVEDVSDFVNESIVVNRNGSLTTYEFTASNSTPLKDITAWIEFDESTARWGHSLWFAPSGDANASNVTNTSSSFEITPTMSCPNYSVFTINDSIWRTCRADVNGNGVVDRFEFIIPHFSEVRLLAVAFAPKGVGEACEQAFECSTGVCNGGVCAEPAPSGGGGGGGGSSVGGGFGGGSGVGGGGGGSGGGWGSGVGAVAPSVNFTLLDDGFLARVSNAGNELTITPPSEGVERSGVVRLELWPTKSIFEIAVKRGANRISLQGLDYANALTLTLKEAKRERCAELTLKNDVAAIAAKALFEKDGACYYEAQLQLGDYEIVMAQAEGAEPQSTASPTQTPLPTQAPAQAPLPTPLLGSEDSLPKNVSSAEAGIEIFVDEEIGLQEIKVLEGRLPAAGSVVIEGGGGRFERVLRNGSASFYFEPGDWVIKYKNLSKRLSIRRGQITASATAFATSPIALATAAAAAAATALLLRRRRVNFVARAANGLHEISVRDDAGLRDLELLVLLSEGSEATPIDEQPTITRTVLGPLLKWGRGALSANELWQLRFALKGSVKRIELRAVRNGQKIVLTPKFVC